MTVGKFDFRFGNDQQAHSDKATPTPPVMEMVIEIIALKVKYAIASSKQILIFLDFKGFSPLCQPGQKDRVIGYARSVVRVAQNDFRRGGHVGPPLR